MPQLVGITSCVPTDKHEVRSGSSVDDPKKEDFVSSPAEPPLGSGIERSTVTVDSAMRLQELYVAKAVRGIRAAAVYIVF